MEPTAKRPRLGVPSHLSNLEDDDDELNFDPEEISQRRDPGYQLQKERTYAANRLKSTFEHIFEKYERDFSGVGDEIDLRTGEIVVNNGHLHAMRNEKDVGDEVNEDEGMLLSEMFDSESDHDDEDDEEDGEDEQPDEDAEEDRILLGKSATAQPAPEAQPAPRKPTSASRNAPVPTPIRLATQNRLASLNHSRYTPVKPSPLSSGAWEVDDSFVDPTWRAPPLVRSSLPPMRTPAREETLYQFTTSSGTDSLWASDSSKMAWPSGGYVPRARGPLVSSSPTRRFMPAPPAVDDEDEILIGGPVKTTEKRTGTARANAAAKEPLPKAPPLSQEKARPEKKQPKNAEAPGKRKKPAPTKLPQTPGSERKKPHIRPRHTFVVAIPFRSPPPPESLTIVDDTSPRSDRTRAGSHTPIPEEATQDYPVKIPEGETEPFIRIAEQPPLPSASPQPQASPVPATAAPAPEEDPESTEQKDQPPRPVEQFSRNEIDPSYEFSDEDDLPPRKPLETALSVPEEKEPAIVVEADEPQAQDAQPVVKRKPGRPKGWKKQKSKSEDVLPATIEAKLPSSPSRLLAEEQLLLPTEVIIRDSEEDPSSAEVVESPERKGLEGDQELPDADDVSEVLLPDAEETPAAQEQPDDDVPKPQQLPNTEEVPEAQELSDAQEPMNVSGDVFPEDLPMSDPPETEKQTADAAPEKTDQEPSATIAPNKRLRNLALTGPIAADIPSPVRSDDSLGVVLDNIIASQGLFDESDRNPDSSPAKPAEESPTSRAISLRSSMRKRRKSVHFLEGEVWDNQKKSKIVSTPPLRRGSLQPEEVTVAAVQEPSPSPQDNVPEPPPEAPEFIDLTSISDEVPPSPAGGMFAPRRARRRKGASLSSSPAPAASPALKKPAMRRPAMKRIMKESTIKRRSLLSIALVDSDDEDPLSAMSLLTTWTAGVAWSPYGASSTPLGSIKHNGGDSTTRKRIAREGFGGLSTPTKRTGLMAAASPSGSVIYTPGGHARRCGVDGFRCDRDFCFTCLDG